MGIYKLIINVNIRKRCASLPTIPPYHPIPPQHVSVSAQSINKRKSMPSSILIMQCLKQLKVKLQQN